MTGRGTVDRMAKWDPKKVYDYRPTPTRPRTSSERIGEYILVVVICAVILWAFL